MMPSKSVSIKSFTRYISSKFSFDVGGKIVLILIMFSCCSSLRILSSLNVLYMKTLCSNALSIFLIANKLFS
jgi:hypothetical protein